MKNNLKTHIGIGNIDRIVLLETFYRTVLKKEVSLSDIVFPERDDATGRMVHILDLNYNEMMENISMYFGCEEYRCKKNDNIQKMQQRPGGIYTFAYHEKDEPDKKHLGKSQNRALNEGFPFADHTEYILITAFNRFTKGKWMDKYPKVTRTSSRWSDGYQVCGCWNSGSSRLYLGGGYVVSAIPGNGPCELFI